MSRRPLALAVPAAALLGLVLPATASAGALGTVTPCQTHIPTYDYVSKGDPFPTVVNVSGGTPGARLQLAATVPGKGLGSAGSVLGTFDGAGNAVVSLQDISIPGGSINPSRGRTVQLSVQDFGLGGAVIAVGKTKVTTLAISIASKPRNYKRKRTVAVSGGPFAKKRLYGFVVKGSKGKHVIKKFRLGKANACGYARRKVAVGKGLHTGKYRLYVNAGKKLKKSKALHYSFRIYRYRR